MESVIQAVEVTKIYQGKIKALDKVTVEVKRGEIFALLGLNGAGKTTLMKILLSLTRPTSGSVYIFGTPVSEGRWKGKIGYLPELFRVSDDWRVDEVVKFLGALSDLKGKKLKERVKFVLETVDLYEERKRRVKTLSKGMMLRLGLAQALVHNPEILFLDEPTEGLDPMGRMKIRKLLLDLKSKGVTIFLNSHLLSEVEILADRIGILHKGKLIISGTLSEVMPRDEKYKVELSVESGKEESLRSSLSKFNFSRDGLNFVVIVEGMNALNEVLGIARNFSAEVKLIAPLRNTLEDVFVSYIKGVQ
jgi:ABC-2 type transport system ATP-binding protein